MSAKYSLDDTEAAIFAAELGSCPQVDLHGLDRSLALHELSIFFHHEVMHGTDAIKIIHGRGNQILRTAILAWLKEPGQKPLIAKFRDSQNPSEQGAVTYVALHRIH